MPLAACSSSLPKHSAFCAVLLLVNLVVLVAVCHVMYNKSKAHPLPLITVHQSRVGIPFHEEHHEQIFPPPFVLTQAYRDTNNHRQLSHTTLSSVPYGPNLTTSCGSFSTGTRSGFLRDKPIDSVVSVTFDMEATETPLAAVVSAMGADMTNKQSDYHSFLSKRHADIVVRTESEDGKSCQQESFKMDVVYTYVNPNSESHNKNMEHCTQLLLCSPSRFRDWNELEYSMRALYRRAVCTHDGQQCDGKASAAEGAFVRKIHIVVANRDQVPSWLDASHPMINVVTHEELFAADGGSAVLPTFNSHAIETAIHRISGLSRFFVYFNNDMFLGRHLSFFDYFRPLSTWRQRQREAALPPSCSSNASSAPGRVTVMFEPLFYFENVEDRQEFYAVKQFASADDYNEKKIQSKDEASRSNRSDTCSAVPVRANAVFAVRQRMGSRRDFLRHLSNFNKRLMFDRIVGGWPSHSFAHYPRLMDRLVLHEMQEVDFADVSKLTRGHRMRSKESLWTTYLYQYYALGHRRAVDAAFVVAAGLWQRPQWNDINSVNDLAPLVDASNGRLADIVRPEECEGLGNKVSSSLLREKIFNVLVMLDAKPEPVYHFCMLQTYTSLHLCRNELQATTKLFITLNDDFYFDTGVLRGEMMEVLKLVSGGDVEWKASWER